MITLTEQGIRWGREDVRPMARTIGSEHAVVSRTKDYRFAPPLMSILKQAERKNGYLSPRAIHAIESRDALVRTSRQCHRREDAELDHTIDPRAHKYFKHQRADLAWLYEFRQTGVLNASEPGTGKTLVAIRYPTFLRTTRNMIIVPNAAKDQWATEIRRWTKDRKLPITIIRGTVKEQVKQITRAKDGWVIGHWESLVHARDGWLDSAWHYVCLDEVHHIGNRKAGRTETVHDLTADYRMAMDGHPYANGVDELYSVLQFLYPDIYTGFWRWAHLQIEIEEGPWGGLDMRSPKNPKLLRWELEPFRIRHLFKDVFPNLKPVAHDIRRVDLSPKGWKEYDQLKTQFFASLEGNDGERNVLAIPSVLAKCTRLRQYLIDPGLLDAKEPSAKYPVIQDLVKELRGTPPVIFSMFRTAAIRLKRKLVKAKLRVGMILGGMQHKINTIKRRFLRGRYDALIVLVSVGGQSLNLGKFGKVIYLDHPWTHRDVDQTIARVRRPEEGTGKLVPVTVYHVVVRNSYEVRMAQIRADKHEDFAKVFTVEDAEALFT